jgi:hypothetical protein
MSCYPVRELWSRFVWKGDRFVLEWFYKRKCFLRRRRSVQAPWWEDADMLQRRNHVPTSADGSGAASLAFPDDLQGCPTVWEFLTLAKWPDGKPRELGTVLFFCDGAGLKARLMDNDCGLCAFSVIDTAEGVWNGVEHALTSTSTDWRPAAKPGGQRKGK